MNLNRYHYDIYPEFYLKLSTLFPSSPTSSHHQSKWLESQFHMKKNSTPFASWCCCSFLPLAIHQVTAPQRCRCTGCFFYLGICLGKTPLVQKDTKRTWDASSKSINENLEGKSCAKPATPATPEMFYSANTIPKVKLPKLKLYSEVFFVQKPPLGTGTFCHIFRSLFRWCPQHCHGDYQHITKRNKGQQIS